jgi:hypothetical protein
MTNKDAEKKSALCRGCDENRSSGGKKPFEGFLSFCSAELGAPAGW